MTTTITMRLRRGLAAGVVGALALTGATFVASPESRITSSAEAVVSNEADEVEDEKAVCEGGDEDAEFGGRGVSQTYVDLFKRSTPAGHFLRDYVPQGLGVWKRWAGGPSIEDLFLVGMHHEDEKPGEAYGEGPLGLLYGMTTGGTLRGYAYLPAGAHAGGVKVHNGWVYVQHDNRKIRRYSVEHVRKAFAGSLTGQVRNLGDGWDTATISAGSGVSFFDIDGGYLYAGYHNPTARGEMYRYKIKAKGKDKGNLVLDDTYGPIQIPKKAQGLLVLSDTWIFSTSLGRENRGNIYVIRRGLPADTDFTTTTYKCFRSVALIQELVGYKGRTYLLNESGADFFADDRIHYITHLHVAQTGKLRDLVW